MFTSKKFLIGIAIIFVGFTLFYMFRGDYGITINFKENVFSVDGPQGTYFSSDLQDVEKLVYAEDPDLGDTSGVSSLYGYSWGTCKNDRIGSFTLVSLTKLDDYIVIIKKDGTACAFNMENAESTKSLYDSLLEMAESSGFHPQTSLN